MSPQITSPTVHSVAWEAGRAVESLSIDLESVESILALIAQSEALDERSQSAMNGLRNLLVSIRSRACTLQILFDDTSKAHTPASGPSLHGV